MGEMKKCVGRTERRVCFASVSDDS